MLRCCSSGFGSPRCIREQHKKTLLQLLSIYTSIDIITDKNALQFVVRCGVNARKHTRHTCSNRNRRYKLLRTSTIKVFVPRKWCAKQNDTEIPKVIYSQAYHIVHYTYTQDTTHVPANLFHIVTTLRRWSRVCVCAHNIECMLRGPFCISCWANVTLSANSNAT